MLTVAIARRRVRGLLSSDSPCCCASAGVHVHAVLFDVGVHAAWHGSLVYRLIYTILLL
jgi:hypothetical protein